MIILLLTKKKKIMIMLIIITCILLTVYLTLDFLDSAPYFILNGSPFDCLWTDILIAFLCCVCKSYSTILVDRVVLFLKLIYFHCQFFHILVVSPLVGMV